ncbi:MAG: DUF3320 domain-containing protein [Planctomycetes bacterium]|nr:DUF3320 domain-containing protein [Planctomycetota bacterium]
MNQGVRIEARHEGRLCHAMQQSAVPWLSRLEVHNDGATELRDVSVHLRTEPAFVLPFTARIDAIPPGGSVTLSAVDPLLDLQLLANTVERHRAELRIDVRAGDEVLATSASTLDVLAWNEWPGLSPLPELVASFVMPNHPALAPLLHSVAMKLAADTGSGALDGYQSGDLARVRAMVAAVHEAVADAAVTYVTSPPSFERTGQKVRTPEQVLTGRLGTCFDLALLHAALLEHVGLHPMVVLLRDHAFVGAWLASGSTPEAFVASAVELRKRVDLGALAVVECTMACVDGRAPFVAAAERARARLADEAAFVAAIDVAAARRSGILPLPPRTAAFHVMPPEVPMPAAVGIEPAAAAPPPHVAEPVTPVPEPPRDRLEHWKGKLLDLSLWNRLLNFVETKKTIPLDEHELSAVVQRLQSGARVRLHARSSVGKAGEDPRDLAVAQQRSGVDVRAAHLAEELRAGRLRATLEGPDLDARLVEIFRHARTSLEESGANTLYLAVGFLQWFETPQSQKARRAPLLLLPLQIERLSVQEGFRFVLDDAEPRINQSLLQMLARDHDLRLPLGDAPPEDDDGVDVGAVLDAFRAAVLALPRWEVLPVACIGFFSFAKYLMWLDLNDRDELLRSPVLRHLVERPGTAFVQDEPEVPRDEIDERDASTVLCPKDADSSQLAAVLAGAAGRSFVLEGPPGTGKSQTITNLIAQALANEKRVLFVAEKRAALEVVQRRLDEVGLGPFCIELHSSKSGPKAVLQQLRRAMDVGTRREPEEWMRLANSLQQERARLNAFVASLHRPREHRISVFAAMGELVALGTGARVLLPDVPCRDAARVQAVESAVVDLANVAAAIGVPDQEPWWGVRRTDWTPALSRDVPLAAQRVADAARAADAAVARVATALGLDAAFGSEGPSAAQLALLRQLAARMAAPSLPPTTLLACDWRAVRGEAANAVAVGSERRARWAGLAPRWRPELLQQDLAGLLAAHRDAVPSFFLSRWWRLRTPRRVLATVAATARLGAPAAVLADLETAVHVRAADERLATFGALAAALGAPWQGERTDWASVEAWCAWVDDVRRILVQIVPGALQPDARATAAIVAQLERFADGSATLPPEIAAMRATDDELAAALQRLADPLQLDRVAAFGGESAPGHLRRIEARARGWSGAVPRLRDHCAYERAAQAAAAAGAAPLVASHANGATATPALRPVFRRTFLETWLDAIHRDEPELGRFRGQDHEVAIARFGDLDRRAITLAAEVVLARLAARVPQMRDTQVASSELGILEREMKKQRRQKPVRRLLAEIPGLFARLAPCVLMSPLSVAHFLGRARTRFDLVVFDEASQIPVWDAVGAIGRGTSVIVVGDSRQLPPTTFFQRVSQGDEPLPDEVPEDLESVLDECVAAGLPRAHLDWHYRSRHESLIAFSNRNYYDNRLLTFPAPAPAAAGLGVRLVHVDGVYDRAASQQNRREADALVADVVARLRDPSRAHHSVGIVTFSQAQQVLIEDLLDRARVEHPEIEPAFASAAEPVFVKNLENVQGDERDVILFSVCYGPDPAGKIHENYGPLNQQGGERRLNVAVTRARRELVVFASVRADQVATRSQSLGARHLRAFLDYAQRGPDALVAATTMDPSRGVESPFEANVCTALRARGHEVHTQVGCSGYRIDLAVVDPGAPGRYLLGIECDGAAYHSAATARDRDRLRAAVLQGLGWRLHRVWSTDYWQDPGGELERVEAALAAARTIPKAAETPRVETVPAMPSAAPIAPSAEPAGGPGPESGAEASPPPAAFDADGPRPYVGAVLPAAGDADTFVLPRSAPRVREAAHRVLAAEGPIVLDRLVRSVAEAWGIQRVTDRVRERVSGALPADAVVVEGVVWADRGQAESFRGFRVPASEDTEARVADELPAVEVDNAMTWLLRQHQALSAVDLARETARTFGIQRLGTVVREVMDRSIERIVTAGRGVRDGDVVRLP